MFVSHKSTVVVIISPIKSPFIVQVVLLIMAWFMFDVVVLNLASSFATISMELASRP